MTWHRGTIRHGHRGSSGGRHSIRFRVAAEDVEPSATGVGAGYQQGAVLVQVAVRHPGRNHDDVAGCQLDLRTGRAAEADHHLACGDAQHLVRDAIEMVEAVDAELSCIEI